MIRAACYERVSTEEQAMHGFSIDTQISLLSDYARDKGYKLVGHYTDEGVSGRKPYNKRPAMSRLLSDVKAGKIDIILFTKLDRWYRNTKEYYKTQDILQSHKCDWKTILQDYDTTTANGRMVIGIMLSINQQEAQRTSERIKVVFDNKRKNGQFTNGKKPFGYTVVNDGNGRRLVKDPETKDALEAFFAEWIRTHNKKKARDAMLDHGLYMNMNEVYRFTNQARYFTGEYLGIPDYCEPYITPQQLADINATKVTQHHGDTVYLFSGLIPCEKCGRSMIGQQQSHLKKSGERVTSYNYRCRYHIIEECANATVLTESLIEKQLIDRLDDEMRSYVISIEQKSKSQRKKPGSKIPALKEKLRRLNESYINGFLEDEEYKTLASDLKRKIQQEEQTVTDDIPNTDSIKRIIASDWREAYLALTRTERQRFWRQLFQHINVEGRSVITPTFK